MPAWRVTRRQSGRYGAAAASKQPSPPRTGNESSALCRPLSERSEPPPARTPALHRQRVLQKHPPFLLPAPDDPDSGRNMQRPHYRPLESVLRCVERSWLDGRTMRRHRLTRPSGAMRTRSYADKSLLSPCVIAASCTASISAGSLGNFIVGASGRKEVAASSVLSGSEVPQHILVSPKS
ncbi:hypothetical protein EYF80_048315 [Liparis tanakae]|uniref:Uncharacterized protein n=1 Tax=Liparis tanakae TaxID=230148 RepID=A0A4Z2FK30_9TELE|nr:hypothetical protein EYF80_048315 [Liparis tanakae]